MQPKTAPRFSRVLYYVECSQAVFAPTSRHEPKPAQAPSFRRNRVRGILETGERAHLAMIAPTRGALRASPHPSSSYLLAPRNAWSRNRASRYGVVGISGFQLLALVSRLGCSVGLQYRFRNIRPRGSQRRTNKLSRGSSRSSESIACAKGFAGFLEFSHLRIEATKSG